MLEDLRLAGADQAADGNLTEIASRLIGNDIEIRFVYTAGNATILPGNKLIPCIGREKCSITEVVTDCALCLQTTVGGAGFGITSAKRYRLMSGNWCGPSSLPLDGALPCRNSLAGRRM